MIATGAQAIQNNGSVDPVAVIMCPSQDLI